MKSLTPAYKDDTDRIIVVAMIILSIFFIFVPSLLVVLFGKDRISESSCAIAKAFFNFELLMFLISLFFMVPIIGWIVGFILCPIMYIVNIVVCVVALCAIAKGGEIKVPVFFEFV